MTDSNESPATEHEAAQAAQAAFDALGPSESAEPSAHGVGGADAEAHTPTSQVAPSTQGRIAASQPDAGVAPRPFSMTLEEAEKKGDPGVGVTWAAGYKVASAQSAPHKPSGTDLAEKAGEKPSKRRLGRKKAHDKGRDAHLVRTAESAPAADSDRSTKLKQIGIVAAVILVAAMGTLIVASALRGPAREEARLEAESELNGLGAGDEATPDPVPADETEGPPKTAPPTAPPSTAPDSKSGIRSGPSSVKTAPPSTSPTKAVTPVVTQGQQIIYVAAGGALAFTTSSGNCAAAEGNPLCTHIGLKVGEKLVVQRVGETEPPTNIWLLDTTGGLALVSEDADTFVFEAKQPTAKGNIVIYAEGGVIPLFIDFAIGK